MKSRIWAPFGLALQAPGVRGSLASGQLWAIGASMLPLGTLLLVRHGGASLAAASLVLAASTLMTGLAAPATARWVATAGMTRPLTVLSCAHGLALAALIASVQLAAPLALTVAGAALAGALRPPIIPALRTVLADASSSDATRRTAFSMLALLQEAGLIIGPAAVAVLAALASPVAAVALAALLAVAGGCRFARVPVTGTSFSGATRRPPRGASVWALLVVSACCGGLFGALDVAAPAFGDEVELASAAGLLLSALSAGIAIGSFAQGARPLTGTASRRIVQATTVTAVMAVLVLPLAGTLLALVPVFALGLCLSAVLILQSEVIEEIVPRGAATELGAYSMTAFAIGAPSGTLAAGLLSDFERGPLVVGAGFACLAVCATLCLARGFARAQRG